MHLQRAISVGWPIGTDQLRSGAHTEIAANDIEHHEIFSFFSFFLLFIESDIYTKPFAIVCLLSRVMEVKCYDRLPISLAQNGKIIWRQMNEWTQSSHLGLDWFFVFVFHSNRTRIDCFRIRDTPACEWILCDSADSYVSRVNLSADRVLDSSSAQNIYFSLPAHTIFNWDAVAILLLFFFFLLHNFVFPCCTDDQNWQMIICCRGS